MVGSRGPSLWYHGIRLSEALPPKCKGDILTAAVVDIFVALAMGVFARRWVVLEN